MDNTWLKFKRYKRAKWKTSQVLLLATIFPAQRQSVFFLVEILCSYIKEWMRVYYFLTRFIFSTYRYMHLAFSCNHVLRFLCIFIWRFSVSYIFIVQFLLYFYSFKHSSRVLLFTDAPCFVDPVSYCFAICNNAARDNFVQTLFLLTCDRILNMELPVKGYVCIWTCSRHCPGCLPCKLSSTVWKYLFLYPCQHGRLGNFLVFANLISEKWYLVWF